MEHKSAGQIAYEAFLNTELALGLDIIPIASWSAISDEVMIEKKMCYTESIVQYFSMRLCGGCSEATFLLLLWQGISLPVNAGALRKVPTAARRAQSPIL